MSTAARTPAPPPAEPPAADPAPAPAKPAKRRRPLTPGRIITTALLIVAVVYFLTPVYWTLLASTKTTGDLYGSSGLWFADEFTLFANVRAVLTEQDGIFVRWAFNSLLYSVGGATVAALIAAMAGYALAIYDFRGREAAFNTILAGVLIPGTALALPMYLLFGQLGLTDTYFAVLLPSMVSPFGVYLARIYCEAAVPPSLLEAARLDGASEARIFFTVVLPALKPALVTVFLFQLIAVWNNYFLPLVMLSEEPLYPVTLGLVNWNVAATRAPELTQLTVTGAMLSLIPLVVLIVALQRFFRAGLTSGSVKN